MRRTLQSLLVILVVAAGLTPVLGQGQPIDFDLRNWTQEGIQGNATWEVAADGTEVLQTTNGDPTYLVSPEQIGNATVTGRFEVTDDAGDDDLIGFVVGYNAPTQQDPLAYDHIVLDWKGTTQNFGSCGSDNLVLEGFALYRVSGDVTAEEQNTRDFNHHIYGCQIDPRVEVLDTNYGEDLGWEEAVEYALTVEYSPTNIRVLVDDVELFDVDGTFEPGSFGFYNYSQANVRYSGFAQEPMPTESPMPTETPTEEPTEEPQPGEPGTSVIDGGGSGDPVDVAVEICDNLVPQGGATQVAVARDDEFADALAGAQLPFIQCILFTAGGPDQTLDSRTRSVIDRVLQPGGVVYVLGGVDVVSQAVQDELGAAGYEVRRLAGPTRFETAEAIAEEAIFDLGQAGRFPQTVVVGFGGNWPDVITAGAWAHTTGNLIVLTGSDQLHPAAERTLQQVNPERTVVVGGSTVLSDAVLASVPNGRRVAGPNRMGTAAEIARQLWPEVPATGEDFIFANLDRADGWTLALAAAPLSRTILGPQLGLRVDSVPPETTTYLRQIGFDDIPSRVFLGDLSFVSDEVINNIEAETGG